MFCVSMLPSILFGRSFLYPKNVANCARPPPIPMQAFNQSP